MKQMQPCVQLVPDSSIHLLSEKEIENPYPVLDEHFNS